MPPGPAEDGEQAGVLVGPEGDVRQSGDGPGDRECGLCEEGGTVRKKHPGGERFATSVVRSAVDLASAQARVFDETGEHGGEIEVLVGDVEGQDAAGSEVTAVKGEGFAREEMRRDAVAGEGVDHEKVEGLWGFGGEGEAGVAGHDVDGGGGVASVGKEVRGDPGDEWID